MKEEEIEIRKPDELEKVNNFKDKLCPFLYYLVILHHLCLHGIQSQEAFRHVLYVQIILISEKAQFHSEIRVDSQFIMGKAELELATLENHVHVIFKSWLKE